MTNSFNKSRFNDLLIINLFDIKKKHSNELKDLINDIARNNIIRGSIALDKQTETGQKYFREIVDIVIKTLFESIDINKKIDPETASVLKSQFQQYVSNYITNKCVRYNSALISQGYSKGLEIDSAIAQLKSKLHIIQDIGTRQLNIKIDKHNEERTSSFEGFPDFEAKYPIAYRKWKNAYDLLNSNDDSNITVVGHLCREAIQEFADVIANKNNLSNQYSDKDKPIGRIKAIIESKKTGSKKIDTYYDKLYEFWNSLNGAVQRQEHAGLQEKESINLDDAKRIVNTSLLLMSEVDKL